MARFNGPTDVAYSRDGTWLCVADTANNKIRRVDAATGEVSLLAGADGGLQDGDATSARFQYPSSVAFSPDGLFIVVADTANNKIRKIDLRFGLGSASVTTLAPFAAFSSPSGVSWSPLGGEIAVADSSHRRIARIRLPG